MGIANISSNSFYHCFDDDNLQQLDDYVAHFDIIDIGAESTKPKSRNIELAEEIDRLSNIMDCQFIKHKVVSLDSKKHEVCEHYADKIDIVNDVSGID